MDNILDAIAYSRFSGDTKVELLTRGEIICCHQHRNLRKRLPEQVEMKIEMINNVISATNWQCPQIRYNSEMAIEVLDEEIGIWRKTEMAL